MSKTVTPYGQSDTGKKQQVAVMFNNISKEYDFLNHFLSFGIDRLWRRKAISSLKRLKPERVLDVATGTGDFALESIKVLKPKQVVGVDISEGMLSIAEEKIKNQELENVFTVEHGDSENLRFENNSFDAVTVAFGVRNFENLHHGLTDICRVLRPGGQAVILEFSNPKKFPIRQLYSFYSKYVLPTIGKLVSKDNRAYTYLPESIAQFPDGAEFTNCLKEAGFREALSRPQTFGICTIYIATK
ncbi:bifunctional demethylmenaquinone methyltransferase/2-methoxy-6-polyprenyl-1,4-benzoquinol methylase UbiE [Albibacterium profundi]|uniref:Demethylmenaquinone methyltransferase n=1 Tax=Albibacterium profundi TaxID=3134906 RepID=A0ABV5CF27_9SPHI